MLDHFSRATRRSSLFLSGAAVLAVGVSGCGTTAERPHINLQEDYRTCSSFGSDPGSRAYAECMLAQQRRRDTSELNELEKNRLINESARDAYAAAALARRARCDRDPDRSECRR